MSDYDLVISGGTVVTASDQYRADVGIRGETIAAVGLGLSGKRVIEADGLLVMPGGVDTHCHIEQLRPNGDTDEETFETGSASALLGGTTTAITFSTQFKGHPIAETFAEYQRRARQSRMDYGFHQIVTDPTEPVLRQELPALAAAGVRSFKVFLTYDPYRLDDRQYIDVLAAARRSGAFVTVHCENYDAIKWRSEALVAAGLTAARYHAWSRPIVVEREATYRAIALAELVDQPIQIFHVSCAEVAEEVARAQARSVKVWAETCPHYLVLSDADMDRPGREGVKFMCSPSPRARGLQDGLWRAIASGTIGVISSDHSGFGFDTMRGKLANGADAAFPDVPNGVPGVGSRLVVLFSEGVAKGRITPSQFVALTATNPAALFGLARKGRIAPGADADLVLWDPSQRGEIRNAELGHAIDYTPYEGMETVGAPVMTLLRGTVVMRERQLLAAPGFGRYQPRGPYDLIKPAGYPAYGFDAAAHR